MIRQSLFPLLLVNLFITLTPSIVAQETSRSLGLGAILNDSAYKGKKTKFLVIPNFSIQHKNFSIRALSANYTIEQSKNLSFNINLRPAIFFKIYESKDSVELEGMRTKRGGVDLGLESTYKLSPFSLRTGVYQDISNEHGGWQAIAAVRFGMPINVFLSFLPFTLLSLEYGAHYYSSTIMQHLFGIRSTEANAWRATYSPNQQVNSFAQASIVVNLSEKWSLFSQYYLEWLGKQATKSPIIAENKTVRAILSFSYKLD